MDNIGQYTRRDNIKIFGIECKENENVEEIVLDVAKDAGVTLTKEDISIAHRIHTRDDTTSATEVNMHNKPKKKSLVSLPGSLLGTNETSSLKPEKRSRKT